MKEFKTLREMAGDADELDGQTDGITCRKCGCRHFLAYGSRMGVSVRLKYEECRNCGHCVLTSSRTVKRIVRDVQSHDSDE